MEPENKDITHKRFKKDFFIYYLEQTSLPGTPPQ